MNQKVVELQNIMQQLQSSAKRLFFSLNRSAARQNTSLRTVFIYVEKEKDRIFPTGNEIEILCLSVNSEKQKC